MKIFFIAIGALVALSLGAILLLPKPDGTPPPADSNVLTAAGLHWHPQITIYVKGEKQDIPANIGIGMEYASTPTFDSGMRMTAMHTHEPDGTIHLEFPGRVTREDTTLGNFFAIWGKDMMEFGSSVAMTVNGKENTELGEYEMRDGDKIELRYE